MCIVSEVLHPPIVAAPVLRIGPAARKFAEDVGLVHIILKLLSLIFLSDRMYPHISRD